MSAKEGTYPADERKTVLEARGVRVRLLRLSGRQRVPWHYHTEITDTFFCMEGPMRVLARDPAEAHVLEAGQTLEVRAPRPHCVSAVDGGPCRFLVVQGVGRYDYVELHE